MADAAARSFGRRALRRFLSDKVLVAFAMVVLLFVVGEIVTPGFISFSHVMTVIQAAFFLGLMALGQTVVVLSGKEGLDLSVGSTMIVPGTGKEIVGA